MGKLTNWSGLMGTWPTWPWGKTTIFSQFYKYFLGLNINELLMFVAVDWFNILGNSAGKTIIWYISHVECLFRNSFLYVKFPAKYLLWLAYCNYSLYESSILPHEYIKRIGKYRETLSSISSANQICSQFNKKGSKATKLDK